MIFLSYLTLKSIKMFYFEEWLLQKCFLCGALTPQAICVDCEQLLPKMDNCCRCCASPVSQPNVLCGNCFKNPPFFDEIKGVFSYQYPLDKLILTAKYGENFSVLKQLGMLMVEHFKHQSKPDVLIPVPSHLKDLKKRGFNQAVELAKLLRKHLQIPLNTESCHCVKHKRPQEGLSAKERHANVRDIFTVRQIPTHWQHIVIVDDVVTTGATVNEIARLCRQQTAAKISVWAGARVNNFL